MIRKPADCRCQYPQVIHDDITGHASDCPVYHRIRATVTIQQDRPSDPPRLSVVQSGPRIGQVVHLLTGEPWKGTEVGNR